MPGLWDGPGMTEVKNEDNHATAATNMEFFIIIIIIRVWNQMYAPLTYSGPNPPP